MEENYLSMFNKQVIKNPHKVIAEDDTGTYTYQKINQLSNQLAHAILSHNVKKEDLIAVTMYHELDLLITLIAILKSGCGFVPIDPAMPFQRMNKVLSESKAKLIISKRNLSVNISQIDPSQKNVSDYDNTLPKINIDKKDLCYCIFTSGSTGKPKGVIIEHLSLSNLIHGFEKSILSKKYSSIAAHTSISFDIFIVETLLPLALGIKVILMPLRVQKNPRLFTKFIKEKRIEILQLTPSRLLQITQSNPDTHYQDLKLVLIGGEKVHASVLEDLSVSSDTRLFNVYGPTETTVWVTFKEIDNKTRLTVGKPFPGNQITILKDTYEVKQGEIGEVCITGLNVGRGYINTNQNNNSSFVLKNGKRSYLTGDEGFINSKGELEILGRYDEQVKINGFRVELDEIRNCILMHPNIKNCIVTVTKKDIFNNGIVAFVEVKNQLLLKEFKNFLIGMLPNYMLPYQIIPLNKIPLTLNGKADKQKLMDLLNRKTKDQVFF
ncbi:amino acid adenylation domain-containing protein [Bacillus sp. 166amftsu]|uniref:amino acid adenylation domain-containing protein n=1 Tax=Bacillus sp. 166amftsu TaxID=1761753 RepID=UPI00089BFD7F|nr:amino acid adenylation domain-containing protein [Bacillus sp. 166amftsu]SDZ37957.1 amino acid adenylation domain-containing protein [Bacillus sp. 166amftsu]